MTQEVIRRPNTYARDMISNARMATEYGGKRFLGFTPSGNEVWISLFIDRNDKSVTINSTHKLSVLLQEGAEFAERMVTVEKNKTLYRSVRDEIQSKKRDRGGQVTELTLKYLDNLMTMAQNKTGKGFVKGIPTRYFIKLVTDSIFGGNLEPADGGVRGNDVVTEWDWPNGEYFIINTNTTIT